MKGATSGTAVHIRGEERATGDSELQNTFFECTGDAYKYNFQKIEKGS